jgi:hypothetical protein
MHGRWLHQEQAERAVVLWGALGGTLLVRDERVGGSPHVDGGPTLRHAQVMVVDGPHFSVSILVATRVL